jgi:ferredoxin--NADP+ reductase
MTATTSASATPLRVAIIGAGPSGFYAAERLLAQKDLAVEVDLYDRLPTPYGLVRTGVAPDHQKIKTVTRAFDKIAAHPGFRFYGHVEFGAQLTPEDVRRHYHATIYAVGSPTDRPMGIPGENLAGSFSATAFVGWYNAHPDFVDLDVKLDGVKRVAVIGNGNVAVDVIRILGRTEEELGQTDIADYALAALARSEVEDIYCFGRRGPAQAAFTPHEMKELGEMADCDIVVSPADLELDPGSRASLETDKNAQKNVGILVEQAGRGPGSKRRRIHMRFLTSPLELRGDGRVQSIRLGKNRLVEKDGALAARATGDEEELAVELCFRAIGYKGLPVLGLPFDDKKAVVPSRRGRVTGPEGVVTGQYVVGWIKRGPTGVIGTNKPDSVETAEALLEDHREGRLPAPQGASRADVEALLTGRGLTWVTYADWKVLDGLEQKRATGQRPRLKFNRTAEMLAALGRKA